MKYAIWNKFAKHNAGYVQAQICRPVQKVYIIEEIEKQKHIIEDLITLENQSGEFYISRFYIVGEVVKYILESAL